MAGAYAHAAGNMDLNAPVEFAGDHVRMTRARHTLSRPLGYGPGILSVPEARP